MDSEKMAGLVARRRSIKRLLALWRKRVQARRELAKLPSNLVRDIGITLDERDRERGLPFWRSGDIVP